MTGTSSESSNPTEPVALVEPVSVDDNGGSLTIDGTVAVSNFPATQPVSGTVGLSNQFDDEYEVLCDTVGPFLRGIRTTLAGAVSIANFTLTGGPYVPVGAVGICPGTSTALNRRDVVSEVLCDTVTSFMRRYTVDNSGVVTIINTTLDGTTAYVPVGAVGPCNDRTDQVLVMADSVGPFIRRFSWDSLGVVAVTNRTLAGAAYVPVGTVTSATGVNTLAVTVTLLSGVASVVTSATARRVMFIFGSASGVTAERPTINGVATLQSPTTTAEQINTLVFGDLGTGDFVPPITFATTVAGDSANVVQEF